MGDKNIINENLVPRDRILPPLHITLGLIKQLVKALDKDGECFKYICRSFPGLCIEKNMLDAYQRLGANMSIKVPLLDRFPANCGDVNDEQGERFH